MLDEAKLATFALDKALARLRQCVPHGRDYYTQDAGAYELARAEFHRHVTGLIEARDYLTKLTTYLTHQAPRKWTR